MTNQTGAFERVRSAA